MKRQDLEEAVRDVLKKASKGKGQTPRMLTTYQILNRIPFDVRMELFDKYVKKVGKNSKAYFTSASRIGKVASSMKDVQVEYIDTKELVFELWDGLIFKPGNRVCGLYQLKKR